MRDYGKKLSHDEVGYEHPARGPHHCSQCEHYQRPNRGWRCEIVQDPIRPEDWCEKFLLK